jgi:hypothetical protein
MPLLLNQPPSDPQNTPFHSHAWQSWLYTMWRLMGVGDYGPMTVAKLPNAPSQGQQAYATNGRKVGESAGSGSGVPVYWSNGAWRVRSTDQPVQA